MVTFLLIVLGMAALSMIFWCIEGLPFVHAIQSCDTWTQWVPMKVRWWNCIIAIPYNMIGALWVSISNIMRFVLLIRLALPLIIDIAITLLLAGAFTLGGVMGTAMGLTMSNILSIVIIVKTKKKKVA